VANRKQHKGTSVHSFADEPPIRYEDIAVEIPSDAERAGLILAAEVEAEYELITDAPESPEEAAPPLASPAALVEFADKLSRPENPEELTGAAQDNMVADMEELKDMRPAQPTECPTCHRPFVAAQMNKEGEETKSSKIRRMTAEGLKKGEIAKALGISYQFVYNVLSRPTKTA
jgi:hypothetical protein